MTKLKKILKIGIIVLIFIFLIVCGMWFVHYNNNIKPMLNNEKLLKSERDSKWVYYSYMDEDIAYSVAAPSFLKFTGNLSAISAIKYDKNWIPINKYTIGFSYAPKLFREEEYWFTIYDYSNAKSQYDYPESYDLYTDSNLNLKRESMSGKYDEYESDIRDFYAKVKLFFGEDTFKWEL